MIDFSKPENYRVGMRKVVDAVISIEREAYSDLQKRSAEMALYWTAKVETLENKIRELENG